MLPLNTAPLIPLTPQSPPEDHLSQCAVTGNPEHLRRLLGQVAKRAGLSHQEIADRMGVRTKQAIQPTLFGTVMKPSAVWVARFVLACGGRLLVEFPRE